MSKLCQVAFFSPTTDSLNEDCLTLHAGKLLIHSLVISRHDYGNGILYGVSEQAAKSG